jgi:hypothetical protein
LIDTCGGRRLLVQTNAGCELLQCLDILVCQGVGTYRAERGWRTGARCEELLGCEKKVPNQRIKAELTELAALKSAIKLASTTS